MRIIAGEKRGLVLRTLTGTQYRPTLGRVKESLFGILSPIIDNAKVLDLFAGSGALGLEALSRGAASVHFVEKSRDAAKTIEFNIDKANYSDRSLLFVGDFAEVGKTVASTETFDLVLADPPYLQGYLQQVITLVEKHNLLAADGILTMEMEKRDVKPFPEEGWRMVREKKYGSTIVWIMRRIL